MNNNNLQQSTLSKHRLGYYQSMQIWEANQPSSLLFRSQDLGSEHTHLGAVVEDASLQSCLWSQVQDHCQQFSDTLVSSFELPESSQSGTVTVELQNAESPLNKTTLQTRLLVAADGGNSFIRKTAGIATTDFNYQQTALTFTVELAQAHKGRAYQRFLESGPVALLPTFSEHHAIVVWSTTSEQAKQWKDHRELVSHINDLFQQGPQLLETLLDSTAGPSTAWLPLPARNILYGVEKVLETLQYGPAMGIQELQPDRFSAPPTITSISSDQFTFPLIRRTVSNYTLPRLALVGDAAHSVHPMAGQGLNLGLQDVDDLVRVITKATDAGMDVSSFLHDYESSRHQQVSLTVGGIHALQQLFHVQSVWAKHVKSMGMNVIQGVGPLRQRLVQAACLGVSSPIS
jgi:ubiquinone biosynthesis UbiH/UbiF/VisC/COQ6 family hydroxylase